MVSWNVQEQGRLCWPSWSSACAFSCARCLGGRRDTQYVLCRSWARFVNGAGGQPAGKLEWWVARKGCAAGCNARGMMGPRVQGGPRPDRIGLTFSTLRFTRPWLAAWPGCSSLGRMLAMRPHTSVLLLIHILHCAFASPALRRPASASPLLLASSRDHFPCRIRSSSTCPTLLLPSSLPTHPRSTTHARDAEPYEHFEASSLLAHT